MTPQQAEEALKPPCPSESIEIDQLRKENAELKAQQNTLVSLIWETRWVSEYEDYQNLVGIAAEIRSGNLGGLNAETADRDQLRLQVARLREALEGALRIKDLWLIKSDVGKWNDEANAVSMMHDKFTTTLTETPAQCASEVLGPVRKAMIGAWGALCRSNAPLEETAALKEQIARLERLLK